MTAAFCSTSTSYPRHQKRHRQALQVSGVLHLFLFFANKKAAESFAESLELENSPHHTDGQAAPHEKTLLETRVRPWRSGMRSQRPLFWWVERWKDEGTQWRFSSDSSDSSALIWKIKETNCLFPGLSSTGLWISWSVWGWGCSEQAATYLLGWMGAICLGQWGVRWWKWGTTDSILCHEPISFLMEIGPSEVTFVFCWKSCSPKEIASIQHEIPKDPIFYWWVKKTPPTGTTGFGSCFLLPKRFLVFLTHNHRGSKPRASAKARSWPRAHSTHWRQKLRSQGDSFEFSWSWLFLVTFQPYTRAFGDYFFLTVL